MLLRLLRRLLKMSHRGVLLCDPAQNQLPPLDIDLLGDEAGIEPDFRHHIVPGIVAPPRAMVLRGRQLSADDALDLREGHRDLGGALTAQVVSERRVLGHGPPPCVYVYYTH